MDDRVSKMADEYRHRRGRRGRGAVADVRDRYAAARDRRVASLLRLVDEVAGLDADGDGDDEATRAEAWERAVGGAALVDTDAEQRRAHLAEWRGALFDVRVREALNRHEWVGDLRLLPGQQAVVIDADVGTELALRTTPGTGPTRFQIRALAGLAALRAEIVAHDEVVVVVDADAHRLPGLVRADRDEVAAPRGDPFAGTRPIGVSVPLLAVPLPGDRLAVCPQVEPWQAIATAQEAGASFGDAIATGVLMMAADAGIVGIPDTVVSPDGVSAIIERDRQQRRLETKIARWRGLLTDADRRLPR